MAPETTPLGDRLGVLGEAIQAANQRARETELDHGRVKAKMAQTTEDITEAYAAGDEAQAGLLSKQRGKLEQGASREAEERLAGAKRAVSRAEAERGLFAAENVAALLSERNADATAVAGAVGQAIEQLGRAHAAWIAMEQEIAGLLRLAGQNTRAVPRFPAGLERLVRDARNAAGVQVPPPLPQTLESAAWSIAPAHDPDPEIREAARAKARAS